MSRRSSLSVLGYVAAILVVFLSPFATPGAWAQHGSEGTVTVTVLDPSGSVVQNAQLELRDSATNDMRKGQTQERGTYTFVDLSLGRYRLTVSKAGFQSQVFTDVVVQAAQTTDISATLKVGSINETVEVRGGSAPLVETTTNSIGTTIDMKQIEDLPIQGRDLGQLSQLIPGYTGGQNNSAMGGTWNGLPAIDQGNNVDGVIGSSSRMKFSGNAEPIVQPRLESMEEMTVQTEQLDMNQGFGQASMQVNFVTRRGGNALHGRVFEDFRNAALNAQSWENDAANSLNPSNPLPKNPIKLNDFGGSIGGPIIKDRLFFFGTFSESREPGVVGATNWLLTPAAQSGVFTYIGTDNNQHQVNLFTLAQNQGVNRPLSPATSAVFAAYPSLSGVSVTPAPTGDLNVAQVNWQVSNPTTFYYPAVRVDYTPNDKMRFNLAWNMTKFNYPVNTSFPPAVPDFPGSTWTKTGGGVKSTNYTAAFGFDWTLSPALINDFRGGFLYNYALFSGNATPLNQSVPQVGWNYPAAPFPLGTQMSGTVDYTATGTYYPLFNVSDTVTWQHRAHTVSFGFSWYQEQDHYYNGVLGFPVVNLGLVGGDPALNAFTGTTIPNSTPAQLGIAQQLYAILTGTIQGVSGQYAYDPKSHQFFNNLNAYNLDELQRAWALHFQDSYRIRPNLTINYGIRWDFTGANHDLTGAYHNADQAAMFGPSGVNNLFNPGVLNGSLTPTIAARPSPYTNWNKTPQPAFGIAWNPHGGSGWIGKLLGGDKTVIRAGVSLKKFTEPQQYFWNQASDIGAFYYQSFALNANNNPGPSNFAPGSYTLNTPSLFNNNSPFQLPAGKSYSLSPRAYVPSELESDFTFVGGAPGANGIEPHIQQPYTESWNFGIQRQLGESRALEIRYVGNRTLRQWMYEDINEVNIFQSGPFGVLTNFKAAQQNLAINNASGNSAFQGSFANHGLAGQVATPLFDAAFAGEGIGADGSLADYTNTTFVTNLNTGSAGAMGAAFTSNNGNAPYFCNLVGASFGPCSNPLNGVNYTGPGAGLPINFLQANPLASGNAALYLVAEGYSNYNGLQVDFRQRQWHGLQFDANYTWSHTLGLTTPNNWQGQTYTFTLRNMRLGYGPSLFDIRHTMNVNGTYDLPFGKGRTFANRGGVVDRIVGGWTLGTIFNFQTGTPFLLGGGNNTFNNEFGTLGLGDGGVVLHGVTPSQLQSSVGVYRLPGSTSVAFLNPKYLIPGQGANPQFISPNTAPGTIGQRVWLYGPHFWNDDLSVSKRFPITERVQFIFQSEMLNIFNHPNFQPGPGGGCDYNCYYNFSPLVQNAGFGLGGISPNFNSASPNQGARVIELRANIEF